MGVKITPREKRRLFSRGVIFTRARSTIPEEKWGTTRSLRECWIVCGPYFHHKNAGIMLMVLNLAENCCILSATLSTFGDEGSKLKKSDVNAAASGGKSRFEKFTT